MQIIKNYLNAVVFSLKYAYQFIKKYLFLLLSLYIIRGALPYLNSYLLGVLVNKIVYAGKANLNNLWWLFVAFAFVSALPAIIREFQRYFERLAMLQFQMNMHMVMLRKRSEIDIGTHEDPNFQNLLQRANRNGGTNPIFQITRSQYDTVNALTGFIIGTILATNFSPKIIFIQMKKPSLTQTIAGSQIILFPGKQNHRKTPILTKYQISHYTFWQLNLFFIAISGKKNQIIIQ